MSHDPTINAALTVAQAAIQWREMAEQAERDRDDAYAALAASEARVSALTAALEPLEAWMTHVISISKDRSIPSAQVLEDGEAVLEIARNVLAAADRQPDGEG